ncbi:uncharacterized protein LOC142350578 isoform X1 [Convolutriloba macropyga]|uniref:uncharacterized protein LOC142350578 isoform X1 n=1 Tax=Convolutriloba macropyga TaxID=536237 RepID=UPI003F51D36D
MYLLTFYVMGVIKPLNLFLWTTGNRGGICFLVEFQVAMVTVVPPSDCFQISLSLDKNLMGYLKSEDTQLFIMNEVLTTCLGTLSFQFGNKFSTENSSASYDGNLNVFASENSAPGRKRTAPITPTHQKRSKTSDLSSTCSEDSPFSQSVCDELPLPRRATNSVNKSVAKECIVKSEVSNTVDTFDEDIDGAVDEDDDDIICVKAEPMCNSFMQRTTTTIIQTSSTNDMNPYESSEIIPGLFSEVPSSAIKADPMALDDGSNYDPETGLAFDSELDWRPTGNGGKFQNPSSHTSNNRNSAGATGTPKAGKAKPKQSTGQQSSNNQINQPNRKVTELPYPEVSQHLDQYYSCPLCQTLFSSRTTAQRHVRTVHGNIRYACQICQKTFNRKDILKQHIQKSHQLSLEVASAMTECPSTKNFIHE